jgi:hypothetical protein
MQGSRTAAAALLCGAAAAALFLSALTVSPGAAILVSLAPLPLFVAGLWLGAGAAALAGLVATGVVLSVARDLSAPTFFAGLYAGPVVLLVRQALLARSDIGSALEWYPPGRLTAWLTGLGLSAVAAALLWLGGPQALQPLLDQALAPALAELIDTTAAQREILTHTLAEIVPGALAASWMTLLIVNGVLAQGVLVRFGRNWRPSPRLAALRLPLWVTVLLAAALLAAMRGGQTRVLGINAMLVLSIPFCLAGLGVLHALAGRLARPAIPLVAFYTLVGLFGWPLLLVALLGLLDVPIDMRRRLAGPRSFGEKVDG